MARGVARRRVLHAQPLPERVPRGRRRADHGGDEGGVPRVVEQLLLRQGVHGHEAEEQAVEGAQLPRQVALDGRRRPARPREDDRGPPAVLVLGAQGRAVLPQRAVHRRGAGEEVRRAADVLLLRPRPPRPAHARDRAAPDAAGPGGRPRAVRPLERRHVAAAAAVGALDAAPPRGVRPPARARARRAPSRRAPSRRARTAARSDPPPTSRRARRAAAPRSRSSACARASSPRRRRSSSW